MIDLITAKPGPADRFDRRLLAPMMIGAVLNPVNSSIIVVPIATALGAPASETAWLVSSLYLATSIGQPLVGRLVDMFGPRRLSIAGAILTGLAGVIGVFAPNIAVLVIARVILGFGTCAGYPAAMYLIRSEATRTGMRSPAGVLTALSVTTQTIAVIGPTLGGLLIQVGGWRATSLVLTLLFLPRHTALDATRPARGRLDFLGIALFAATLVCLLLFLMNIHLAQLWLLGLAAVFGAGFALWELHRDDPFIDVRVFAGNVPLLVTYARAVLAATVSYCYLYGFTQWLEGGRGLSPALAGLVLLPTFGVGIVVAAVFGRRPEIRWKLIVGALGQVVMAVLLLFVGPEAALWALLLIAVVVGVPQGIVNLAIQNTLYHQADPTRMGATSGLLRTFMYLGAMLASAATGAFFHTSANTAGLHELAWFMLGAAVVFLMITLVDRSLRRVDQLATGHED